MLHAAAARLVNVSLHGKCRLKLLCCVRMCYSDSDDPSDTVTGDEEYGSYYSSIRNEEIYQDLCAMGRRAEPQVM